MKQAGHKNTENHTVTVQMREQTTNKQTNTEEAYSQLP